MVITEGRLSQVFTVISAAALGLVVCLHLPSLPQHWLFHFGVPWFFFASGFWFARKDKPFAEQVAQRARTLLAPYFILNMIWFPILFAMNWVGWRYLGAERIVSGHPACVLRCLGLSPFAWPALVPTWFLRALFVTVLVVGGFRSLLLKTGKTDLIPFANFRVVIDLLVTAIFTGVYLAWEICGSRTGLCAGLFNFGLPLNGFACFALGLVVADSLCASEGPSNDDLPLTKFIRRQLMPVYILHDAVIISISWGAKFIGCFAALKTLPGDIIMWFVAILVAILLGELLRRFRPSASFLLFGGR